MFVTNTKWRLADVIALNNNGWFYCHLFYFDWLLLLPILCLWQMLWPLFFFFYGWCYCHGGWCYCHLCEWADVFALCCWLMLLPMFLSVADVMTTVFYGWCYCHGGWWYCHLCEWADVFALLLIDGTAKCDSYWLVVADVMTTMWLADVIAMVADGIGHCWNVSMY